MGTPGSPEALTISTFASSLLYSFPLMLVLSSLTLRLSCVIVRPSLIPCLTLPLPASACLPCLHLCSLCLSPSPLFPVSPPLSLPPPSSASPLHLLPLLCPL